MIFNGGKYLVRMFWIEPNEWLILFNKHKNMIMKTYCYRAYTTKERVKKEHKPKEEVVQPAPEVLSENVKLKSEPSNNDEIIKEIIEKSKREKKKYPSISDYLIQNIMDFPLHKAADFDDDNIGEITSEFVNRFPSISTILNETRLLKERFLLEKWKKKMIAQLGKSEFYSRQSDPVKKPRLKKVLPKNVVEKSKKIISGKLIRGSQFHSYLKNHFLGQDHEKFEYSDNVKGCVESISNLLNELSDVKLVESNVYHPFLHYKGIIDCVALYRNEWHVIEWKVGETMKKSWESTYTAPVQTCAYMGTLSWCYGSDGTEPVSKALVVYAFPDGTPAQVFPINESNSEIFWNQWLMRLQKFWSTRSSVSQGSLEDEQNVDDAET